MARRKPTRPHQLPLGFQVEDSGLALDAFLGDARHVPQSPPQAPAPSETRERAGRAAQRHGEAWERYLRSALAGAVLAAVVACWDKLEVPLAQKRVRTADGWGWELVRGAKASVDFVGERAGGGYFAIECKSTEEGRLPRSEVRPQQAARLDTVAANGDVALLAVEFRHPGRDAWGARQYLIPWRRVPWTVARSAEGLDEADAAPWRLAGGALFDRLRGR